MRWNAKRGGDPPNRDVVSLSFWLQEKGIFSWEKTDNDWKNGDIDSEMSVDQSGDF